MKMNWNYSEKLIDKAVKINKLHEDFTYPQIRNIYKHAIPYLCELNKIGRKHREGGEKA